MKQISPAFEFKLPGQLNEFRTRQKNRAVAMIGQQ
jgi:hypothetical protein